MTTLYEPRSYEPDELKRHGEMIAERLALTPEQVKCLVPELRNALSLASMGISSVAQAIEGRPSRFVKEDLEDIRSAIKRLTAFATALAERERR